MGLDGWFSCQGKKKRYFDDVFQFKFFYLRSTLLCSVDYRVHAWSQYPLWALLNLRINHWSLNEGYPCRVWPPPPLLESNFCVVPHGINYWSPFYAELCIHLITFRYPMVAWPCRDNIDWVIKHWFSNL